MPLTRALTSEEDITMSLSTTITGLLAKYPNITKLVLGSVVANVVLSANQIIEGSSMTFVEKAAFRGDLKTLCNRALRAPLGIVEPNGSIVKAGQADTE